MQIVRFVSLVFLFLVTGSAASRSGNAVNAYTWKASSVLSSGKWVKVKTAGKGIYKVSYDKLKSWGFSAPGLVNVYGSGGFKQSESLNDPPVDDLRINRSWRGKDGSGKDCLFFFSTGTVSWSRDPVSGLFKHTVNPYSNDCFYYLSQQGDQALDPEPATQPAEPATHQVTQFDDYSRHETEQYNLIHSGQQWFGEKFIPGSNKKIILNCPNPVDGKSASLLIGFAGRSSLASSIGISCNRVRQADITFSPVNVDNSTTLYADETQKLYPVTLTQSSVEVEMTYQAGNALSSAWLDYMILNWRRNLRMTGDELYFRDAESIGAGNVAQFVLENGTGIRVLDITDPASVVAVAGQEQGTQYLFRRSSDELREYVAFRLSGSFPEPVLVGEVSNQDLHSADVPDLVVISHPDFLQQAVRVADFHSGTDGLDVGVFTTTQIYNEFGSGIPDATAIRNFIRMFYDRNRKIKYVLLFGDGSFDNRNITGVNKAFVPTYQSDNSLIPTSSFVSDDYFVILDPGESVYNGTMDLGIGRLPVSSAYEAGIVAEKILTYYSAESMGIWRTNICFIGDDQDQNLHMSDSELLADLVNKNHREFQTEKIYFDAFPQQVTPSGERYPGVMEAINQQVKKGVLVLNYVGHANERFLSDERVLDVSTINSWTNRHNLPIFVTATCEFSRFDANETSAGEYILFNPNGGGIALFSTTRVVYAYSNYLLSRNFYRYVFEKDADGQNYRMGDIMRLAKINTLNTLNKRNFTLLADPALRLSYPKHRVVTRQVNQKDATGYKDTLKALSKVTVAGLITDPAGNHLRDFNGKLTAVVYDKMKTLQTLGNGGEPVFSYKVQNNIIYRGEATVTAGEFSLSFVIPKDISYNFGEGKILYYAQNGEEDAHGAFESFVIGGSAGSLVADTRGPEIKVFLDDASFENGSRTSRNPLLLAELSDENGINTVGTGIGHDITAVIDNDYSDIRVLNEYYKAAKDDYRSGFIEYPVGSLTPGEHSLKLKAWDVANNSTEVEVKFFVTDAFIIESVSNHPNPVAGYTDIFCFHNQPDGVFDALVEIFDVHGSRIDLLRTTVSSNGKQTNPVRWNPVERGVMVRNGIYLSRITLRSGQGQLASGAGRMVILR